MAATHIGHNDNNGTNLNTLATAPSAIGNVFVLAIKVQTPGTATVVSVANGGATQWFRQVISPQDSGIYSECEIWVGRVTYIGNLITVTYSSTPGVACELSVDEFSSGLSGLVNWTVVATGTNSSAPPVTTINYPSLTNSTGAIYFGYATTTSTSGSTSGFTYEPTALGEVIYNVSLSANTTYNPTSTASSTTYNSAGIILLPQVVPATTISYVNSTNNVSFPTNTMTLSPAAIGNLQIFMIRENSSSIFISSLAGGGVSNWYLINQTSGPQTGKDIEMWIGNVTSTGSSTLYINYTGNMAGLYSGCEVLEFSSSYGAATQWLIDSIGTFQGSSTTTLSYPTLPASITNELYVGYLMDQGDTETAGTTPGYTYIYTSGGESVVYNLSVSGASNTTNWTTTLLDYYNSIGIILGAESINNTPLGWV